MLCQAITSPENISDGQRHGIAGDEVVLEIPCGDGTALPGIDRIELLAEIGALVDRLGVGVTEEELRATTLVTKCCFERVVVRVGDDLSAVFSP